jgi:hypothetical protein
MTTSGRTSSSRTAAKSHKIGKDVKRLLENSARDDLILTPHLETMLPDWEGQIEPVVAKRLSRIMSTPPRNRSASFSASQAGLCYRRQELAFLGVQPTVQGISPQLRQIFMNGTWVHLRWQATLMTFGLLDNIEVTIKKPSLRARCSMDGIGTVRDGMYAGRDFGFELKGRNDYTFNTQKPKGPDEKTRKQVDFEFLLSGLEIFVILNENKNNQDWTEWVIIRDEQRVEAARSELKTLNADIDDMKLAPMLPECVKQDKDGEFYKCPFGGPNGPCIASGSWPNKIGAAV